MCIMSLQEIGEKPMPEHLVRARKGASTNGDGIRRDPFSLHPLDTEPPVALKRGPRSETRTLPDLPPAA